LQESVFSNLLQNKGYTKIKLVGGLGGKNLKKKSYYDGSRYFKNLQQFLLKNS